MKRQFLTYEISLKLKELGFDEPCLMYYYKDDENKLHSNISTSSLYGAMISEEGLNTERQIKAPLRQQTIDWFREKHNIHIIVSGRLVNDPKKKTYKWEVYGDFEEEPGKLYEGLNKDYYTAYNEAILKAIELIKTK